MEERPVHGVEGLGDVHLEQDARDFVGMEKLCRGLDSPKVIMYSPATNKGALDGQHKAIHVQCLP
jgi:hypothetical protein